jgi:hypothetical protein
MGLFDKLFGGIAGGSSTVSSEKLDLIKREWEQIDILLQGGQPSQLRQALIAADKTLDTALKDVVPGDKMADRIRAARDTKFDPRMYDKVWKAHLMRNSLVHEAGYEPPHHMLKGGISDLRNALSKLGVQV